MPTLQNKPTKTDSNWHWFQQALQGVKDNAAFRDIAGVVWSCCLRKFVWFSQALAVLRIKRVLVSRNGSSTVFSRTIFLFININSGREESKIIISL